MTVVPLFDAGAARAARDEAVDRVDRHADEAWKAAATDAIYLMATKRDEFTTDAVWWLLAHAGIGAPHEERALGALMQAAQRQGWIQRTERTHKSVRPECHARDLRVWRSLIHNPKGA